MNLVILLALFPMFAEDLVEFRGTSNASYRYADWSHSFANKWATDVYYIGVPGYNELTVCGGYSLPTVKDLSLTPFFCGTMTKENTVLGIKAAVVIGWSKGAWKTDAYYAHFKAIRNTALPYDVLDAGNLTYSLSPRLETGISAGFFRQGREWNPLIGPLIRKNDKFGFWFCSYRFGIKDELRFGRTLNLGRPRK
jgi:hypothetical protein